MKRLRGFLLISAALLLGPISRADMHEFTSADGEKKVWAEVTGYDAETKTVSLRLANRTQITSVASAFSEADQAFIEKAGLALEAGRNLWIEFTDVEEKVSEKRNAANGYQTLNLASGFDITVRNNGTVDFTGLNAEYQIFYASYSDPTKDKEKTDKVKKGLAEIPELSPRQEANLETETISMTSIKRLPLKECVGGT